MKFAVMLLLLASSPSALAHERHDARLDATIRRALAEQGEIVTAADRRTVAAKCGLPADRAPTDIVINDGGLRCPDGRVVRDAETRALGDRIGARAGAVADAALRKPEVMAAISAYADEAAVKALKRLRERRD